MRSLAVTIALISASTTPLVAQHQQCAETTIPKTLPAAHEVVDSAGAIEELRAFNQLAPDMQFSLLYTAIDSMPAVTPLEGANVDAVLVLERSIWPQKPSGVWAARLAIHTDSTTGITTLALRRSIYCPPVPEQQGLLPHRVIVQVNQGDHRPPPGVMAIKFKVECWIDEDGNVTSVRVTHSSGFADFDRQMAMDWQTRKFKPALLDGRPIKALFGSIPGTPRL